MDAAFKALADYGVTVVAIVAIALFAWWLVRKYLAFLEAQLAKSQALNDSGSRVIERLAALTEKVDDLADLIRDRR